MRKRAVTSSESKEEQLNCNICSKPQVPKEAQGAHEESTLRGQIPV